MSETNLETVTNVAQLLARFEASLDAAVACGADLAAALPRARVEAKLPALVGQPALDSIGDALQAAILARRHTVASHKHLDKVRELTGLPEIALGEESPKPPFERTRGEESPLRVAA
jgi:hypothetical protein